jgi:branched-chain amino acid transport system ATP-binding protein
MAVLAVEGITKKFGGLVAVRDFDISVDAGEIVGLIGPNGAGKTTAFNVISGVYKPDRGRVIFDGEDIAGRRPDQICRKGLTRTFQLVRPFPEISVLDNVLVGAYNRTSSASVARARAEETLEFLGMTDRAEDVAGSLPIALRKRLEIARALATGPKVMLLDEPMAGLTPSEANETIELTRKISERGIALILVEHVMRIMMSLADRIVVIHHGVKIGEGTPAEIVEDEAVVAAYLGEVQTGATSQRH